VVQTVDKGQGRGLCAHTAPPCPLTHFGDLLDGCAIILSLLGGKATDTAQGAQKRKPPILSPSALTRALKKTGLKTFLRKSMKCFCIKVFESPENFLQKVFWWGLGQRPKTKKT